ncbi:uncharacterized protein VTP21DRAFT_8726 [Calcarisporiella thermophila]|uniref:uncharacterized protein n=1 Tax=Calcarisporiella thermophila TaxID=911321 RepID=UPI003743C650
MFSFSNMRLVGKAAPSSNADLISPDEYNAVLQRQDPEATRDFLIKLHSAYREKDVTLGLISGKLTEREEKLLDLEDENAQLRSEMRGMAEQISSMDERFKTWQERLITQVQQDRSILNEEYLAERSRQNQRISELEEALHLANKEISRLVRTRYGEPNPTAASKPSEVRRVSFSSEDDCGSTVSSFTSSTSEIHSTHTGETSLIDHDFHLCEEGGGNKTNSLEQQILEITERRVKLQLEMEHLEEMSTNLHKRFMEETREGENLKKNSASVMDSLTELSGQMEEITL